MLIKVSDTEILNDKTDRSYVRVVDENGNVGVSIDNSGKEGDDAYNHIEGEEAWEKLCAIADQQEQALKRLAEGDIRNA